LLWGNIKVSFRKNGENKDGKIIKWLGDRVLVDEAIDFSPVQLACMMELATPGIKSFFACGDANQSVTSWGVQREKDAWKSLSLSLSLSKKRSVLCAFGACVLAGKENQGIIKKQAIDILRSCPIPTPFTHSHFHSHFLPPTPTLQSDE